MAKMTTAQALVKFLDNQYVSCNIHTSKGVESEQF